MGLEGNRIIFIGLAQSDAKNLVGKATREYHVAVASPFKSLGVMVPRESFFTYQAAIIALSDVFTLRDDMESIERAHDQRMGMIIMINIFNARGVSASDTLRSMGIRLETALQTDEFLKYLNKQV